MSRDNPRLTIALELAIWRNVPILRLQPGTKIPYPGSRGFKDATTDEATIRGWFEKDDPNIAYRPWDMGCVVLDLDVYKPHDVAAAACIQDACRYIVKGRGFHCYFNADKGYANGVLATGIDIRGANGYVLAPSCVVDGIEYRLIKNDNGPGPLPDWIAEKLNEAKPKLVIPQEDLANLDKPENIERCRRWLHS